MGGEGGQSFTSVLPTTSVAGGMLLCVTHSGWLCVTPMPASFQRDVVLHE